MQIKFDPSCLEEVEEVLRTLKLRHPGLWARVADCPLEGLSVRTRSLLQDHGLCTREQLAKHTRHDAVGKLGEVAVEELEGTVGHCWACETV